MYEALFFLQFSSVFFLDPNASLCFFLSAIERFGEVRELSVCEYGVSIVPSASGLACGDEGVGERAISSGTACGDQNVN
jgi:hypothetical protein